MSLSPLVASRGTACHCRTTRKSHDSTVGASDDRPTFAPCGWPGGSRSRRSAGRLPRRPILALQAARRASTCPFRLKPSIRPGEQVEGGAGTASTTRGFLDPLLSAALGAKLSLSSCVRAEEEGVTHRTSNKVLGLDVAASLHTIYLIQDLLARARGSPLEGWRVIRPPRDCTRGLRSRLTCEQA